MLKFVSSFVLIFLFATHLVAGPKNFIVILTDDQGYEDLGCFGSKRIKTPNIDQMAAEGAKLTSFYTASSVCSPSRAALLTGRVPKRAGVPSVLFPNSQNGLPEAEETIAELLKKQGYSTAIIGKWHLGHLPQFLPTNQGFDYFFGLPYSNDMSIAKELPLAPDIKLNEGWSPERVKADIAQYQVDYKSMKNIMPLMRGTEIIEYPVDQRQLTKRYTEEAVNFIRANQEESFFIYVSHSMPHHPIYTSESFAGSSGVSPYCDSIQEIDWGVGQIINTLKDLDLDTETLVLITSDNGPANRRMSPRGALATPYRGVKFDTFEGGQRVPAVIWAPSTIPPSSGYSGMTSTLDILPTIAHYAGIPLEIDRIYDGYNLADLLAGKSRESPRKEMYYYTANSETIEGVRVGDWKLLLEGSAYLQVSDPSMKPEKRQGDVSPMLFNLKDDPSELHNLYLQFPEKVEALRRQMAEFDSGITS